ncbi:MAG: hypothetical protein ACRDRA_05070 [Pseudonocardiaceae bacterium]
MTTTETFVEATRRNQEAFMYVWTDGVRKFWELASAANGKVSDEKAPGVPTAEEVVDNAFDFAEKVLVVQRGYVKCWLAAVKSMTSSTAWLAQSATKDHPTSKKS